MFHGFFQYFKFKWSTVLIALGLLACYLTLSVIREINNYSVRYSKQVEILLENVPEEIESLSQNQITHITKLISHSGSSIKPDHIDNIVKNSSKNIIRVNAKLETKILEALKKTVDKVPTKKYIIHIWKHGERMARRFLRSYGRKVRDPFRYCSVSNCELSTNDSKVFEADAVMFHLHQILGLDDLPKNHPRNQMWIFFTDESPHNTFFANSRQSIQDYNNIFNWSMTYRHDSDIPVPYGKVIHLETPLTKLPNYSENKTGLVTILGSNCGGQNHRWNYVHELAKHVPVHIYGQCGTKTCPGGFTTSCPLLKQYKFYLAFENTNCKEYMTEKLWWNAYHMESVPVVMGAPKEDYVTYCPPQSFIHVGDFKSPEDLGRYLMELNENDQAYNKYFEWKERFRISNEHGYFGSPSLHFCRMCEKLTSKDETSKVYTDMAGFWNKIRDCA